MNDWRKIEQELKAPFPVDKIHWRIQKKISETKAYVIAYINARDVMNRLDEIIGPLNWKRTHTQEGDTYYCTVSIWNQETNQWIEKTDGAEETKIEGKKGGISDSFKRACVSWGIGRYLYDLDRTTAKIDQYKNIITESLPPLPLEAVPKEEQKEMLLKELRLLYKKAENTDRIEVLFKNAQEFEGWELKEITEAKDFTAESLSKIVNYIQKEIELE